MGLALRIRDLSWSFNANLDPFLVIPALDIAAGENVALCGPSGCGKSSLLFLLVGMELPQKGSMVWGDIDMAGLNESARDAWRRRSIGLVFQDFQLIPELTVLENVLLAASFQHWSPQASIRANALRLLNRVGLVNPRQSARSLSRGEMQRTALARALLFSPAIILADEPTASLDQENESRVSDLLLETCREAGATLIVATHQKRLMDQASRVIRLAHGRLAANP